MSTPVCQQAQCHSPNHSESSCPVFTIPVRTPVKLQSRLSLVETPDVMIPLLPGESIHLGYTPISEEDAFATKRVFPLRLAVSHFRIPRGKVSVDRVITLIHRFTAINDAVDVIVPKRENINSEPAKHLYKSKVAHTWRQRRATIGIQLFALPESDEFAVEVNREYGSVTAHRMFFHTLEKYVLSDGQFYPLILPISVDRDKLTDNLTRQYIHNNIETRPPIGKLQRTSRIDTDEDIYNREISDGEWTEAASQTQDYYADE